MAIDWKDVRQNAIGAFSAIFFIFLLRENPISINPQIGLIMGVVWLGLIFNPFKKQTIEAKKHFFLLSVPISIVVSSILAISFGLATIETLKSFDFFGSIIWLVSLMAVPVAVMFDKKNIDNPILRYFFRRR